MKRIYSVAITMILANTACAETWLCIDEAEAGVTTTAPFESAQIEAGNDKYLVIVNDDTNQVELKSLGQAAMNVECTNYPELISCDLGADFSGFEFALDKESFSFWHFRVFKAFSDGRMWVAVNSGKCSTI